MLKTQTEAGAYQLFDPFESELWLAAIGATFMTAFLMVFIDRLLSGKFYELEEDGMTGNGRDGPADKPRCRQLVGFISNLGYTTYHAFSLLMGGEEYEWLTWPGRLLRVGTLFMALILVSTSVKFGHAFQF